MRNESAAVIAITTYNNYFFKFAKQKSQVASAIGPLKVADKLISGPREVSEAVDDAVRVCFQFANCF